MISNQIRSRFFQVLKLIASLVIITLIFLGLDFSKILANFSKANHWIVLMIVVLAFLQMVLAGFRWHLIGDSTGEFINRWTTLRIMLAGMFCNQVLPISIGGDLVRIGLAKPHGLSIGRAVRSVVLDRVAGLLSLLTLMIFTGVVISIYAPPDWPRNLIRALPVFLILILLTGIWSGKMVSEKMANWIGLDWLVEFFKEASVLLRATLSSIIILLISYSIHIISAMCLWFSTFAVGITVDYIVILGFLPIIILAQLIPVSIAGWGVREGTVVILFSLISIDKETALVASIIWGLSIAIAAVIGGLIWACTRSDGEKLINYTSNCDSDVSV